MVKEGKIISLNHTAIRVKNLQESYKYYHEVLGLPPDHFTPKEYKGVVFLKGLELMDLAPQGKEGFDHLGFDVRNIEAIVKELESKGIKFVMMGDKKIMDVSMFKEFGLAVKIAYFYDQNGTRCELVEWRNI
jgi:catechol 2,3-dioxygenase-like lactoylglutathione lyase family enzyme